MMRRLPTTRQHFPTPLHHLPIRRRLFPLSWWCFLLLLLCATSPGNAQDRDYFLENPSQQKIVIILGGAGAGKKYVDRFRDWTLQLYDMLTDEYGYTPDQVTLLLGRGDADDTRIAGPCRTQTIRETCAAVRETLQPGDQILFFLVGHGTATGENDAKFNVVGPDITGAEFATLLDTFAEQDVIVVNTTSVSLPFCRSLAGPGRVIISATRSRAEKYDTLFPQYFIEALADHAGDRDKNDRVSMWEAFQYAKQSVETWYTDNNRLPSEHATLDDNGDGIFSVNPDPLKDDGRLAQIAYLDVFTTSPDSAQHVPGEREQKLTTRKAELERAVTLLRNRRDELSEDEYRRQMDQRLIDLARTSRDLKNMQENPDD